MLTGKQKSYLRGLGQTLKPVFQIGKAGFTDELLSIVREHLFKNELAKVSVLDTSPVSLPELVALFSENGIDVAGSIGKTILLYKRNPKLKEGIRLPR